MHDIHLEVAELTCGETLRFAMSVLGASAGELTLSARETPFDGRPVYKFELSAISGEFLSKLFLVRDYLASWVDPKTFRSLRFEKHTVEGKRVRDDLVEFDYAKKLAFRNGKSSNSAPPQDCSPWIASTTSTLPTPWRSPSA